MKNKLTVKQRRYVDCYNGDIKESAELAGISYVYAKELHTKTYYAHILKALKERDDTKSNSDIMNRQERQEFWTKSVNFDVRKLVNDKGHVLGIHELDDETAKLVQGVKITERMIVSHKDDEDPEREIKTEFKLIDKNKSSELLGRSEADFTDKTIDDTPAKVTVIEGPLGGLLGKVYRK